MELESAKSEINELSKLKPLKVNPKCSKCGWKSYCKNYPNAPHLKLNSKECIREFIKHGDYN